MGSNPASTFVSLTQPPATKLLTTNIPAPTGLYVTDDDFLRVVSQTVLNTQPFVVQYKLLRASDGVISIGNQLFTNPSDGTVQVNTLALTEGFLLSANIFPVVAGLGVRGTCFVALQLGSGSTSNPRCVQNLVSDYITPNYGLSWPGGAVRSSLDGPGVIISAGAANPAAGAEFSIPLITGLRMKLISVYATLTTSAVVGNRVVTYNIKSGVTVLWKQQYGTSQAASLTSSYQYAPGAAPVDGSGGNRAMSGPTDTYLSGEVANMTLQSLTSGLDVGDQWSSIRAIWQCWIES